MPAEIQFILPLVHGLHARPASVFQEAASAFASDIRVENLRNGRTANAKSVLSLVGTDARHGDACVLRVGEGPDVDAALNAMRIFVEETLPGCDEPIPTAPAAAGGFVPRPVSEAAETLLRGTPVHPGIGVARVVILGGFTLPEAANSGGSPTEETARLDEAVRRVDTDLALAASKAVGPEERGILDAHRAILADPEFMAAVRDEVCSRQATAGQAVAAAERRFGDVLRASESAILRERAIDVRDVAASLIDAMYGGAPEVRLDGPAVCVAESLAPSRLMALDRSNVRALVLEEGGTTSHTSILARAFGIPTVVGVEGATRALASGSVALVDARRGLVVPGPSDALRRWYAIEVRRDEARASRLAASAGEPAATLDGRRVEVAANAATREEAESAFANGADGVGLFRTEFLFMDRDSAPSEDEQYEVYAGVVRAAAGRPVIFRTLDIGGDKLLPYLRLPAEENPFLGYRAVRFYPEHEGLVLAQLRAILRAAALGPARVMFPMVCCVEEVRGLKAMLEAARAGLEAEGAAHGPVEVGVMIEVPAAALSVDLLATEVDFFSIGTNDLAQYVLAVDRGNGRVAGLYDPLHPSFLRLLMRITDTARASGRWVGLCGEMGGQESMAPILAGLGLDEISVAPPAVPAMKAALRACDASACRAMLEDAASRPDRESVARVLAAFASRGPSRPIVAPSIVRLDSQAATRAEVIKEMACMLDLDGRLLDADAVEEAVWQREDVYSTGVGYGVAIPHCKSPHVGANSVGVLRFEHPVEWNSLDGEPVHVALMLAIRETDEGGDTHLKMLSRLARRIMHDDFRERLLTESSPKALAEVVSEALEGR